MEYPVYYDYAQTAMLSAEPQGLYWKLSVCCPTPPQRHLYCQNADMPPLYLGTLVPTQEQWTFCKTIARKKLPLGEQTRFFFSARQDAPVPNGKIIRKDGRRVLQIAYEKDRPFPIMDKIRYFSLLQTESGWVFQCDLDEENTPFFVDNAAKCDTINEVS